MKESDVRLTPLGERVVVRRKGEDKIGSIYIPDDSKKASLEGEVVETGRECTWVKPGDLVLFGKFSGFELPIRGRYKDCLLMNEADILCKITEEKGE